MSYDISLNDPVTMEPIVLKEAHFIQGGTYQCGGTQMLWLNVTWNYGPIFRRPDVLGENGIRAIYGLTGAESIPLLCHAISNLENDVNEDYWAATEGNAKRALCGLLSFARLRPDGVWNGD